MPEQIQDKNLQNLGKLLATLDEERITKSDFVKSFENITNMVVKALTKLYSDVDSLKETYANLLKAIADKHDISLKDLKGQVDNVFVGKAVDAMKQEHSQRMTLADQKIASVRSGKDGLNGIRGERGFTGLTGPAGLLDEKALQILKDEFDKKLKAIPRGTIGGGGAGKKITYIQSSDLSSQVDGVNKAFTLPKKTLKVVTVMGSQWPTILRETIDWTFSGNTLTLTSAVTAPASTQSLIALIEVGFYS